MIYFSLLEHPLGITGYKSSSRSAILNDDWWINLRKEVRYFPVLTKSEPHKYKINSVVEFTGVKNVQ